MCFWSSAGWLLRRGACGPQLSGGWGQPVLSGRPRFRTATRTSGCHRRQPSHAPTARARWHQGRPQLRLVDDAFLPQGNFDRVPHSRVGFGNLLQLPRLAERSDRGRRPDPNTRDRISNAIPALRSCRPQTLPAKFPEILCSSYFISPKVPSSDRSLRLCGLFGSARLERLAQFHARLVQLRFAVADGTSHHGSNLVVLVSFYIVQHKNPSISRRQRVHRPLQPQPVDRARQASDLARPVLSWAPLPRFPAFLPAELREGSSCATASGQRLPPSGAARWKKLIRLEKWQSCEITAEKLPESGLRLPPCWPSCGDTANKRAV